MRGKCALDIGVGVGGNARRGEERAQGRFRRAPRIAPGVVVFESDAVQFREARQRVVHEWFARIQSIEQGSSRRSAAPSCSESVA